MDYYRRINEAINYIEEHLFSMLTLRDIASRSCYSPFHFHKLFQALVGDPVKEYIRKRRFSESATLIASSNRSLIDISMDNQYQSYEAFCRAFKAYYGISPKGIRKGRIKPLTYPRIEVTPDMFDESPQIKLPPPEIKRIGPVELWGLRDSFDVESYKISGDIISLWKKVFRIFKKNGKISASRFLGYGEMVCGTGKTIDRITYFSGVEIIKGSPVPGTLQTMTVPPVVYAVFTYKGPVRRLLSAHTYIYRHWMIENNITLPRNFGIECFNQKYKRGRIDSEIEIWLPIE